MTIAFIAFLLSMAANQVLTSRAQRQLSPEHKALLIGETSNNFPWFFVVLAAVYGVWTLAFDRMSNSQWMLPAFMIVVFTLSLAHSIAELRRLTHLSFPQHYIRTTRLTFAITQAALLALFGAMLYETHSVLRQ